MKDLIINTSVHATLGNLMNALPHALLLSGEKGVGLFTIAKSLSGKNPLVISPRLQTKTSTIKQISVDDIRELYELTRSKSTDDQYVIMDDADTMTIAAQNALLKLLEEPNATISFILTSHSQERLLPTIRSRSQEFRVPKATLEETSVLLSGVDEARKRQIQFIAGGLPAEVIRLTSDEKYFRDTVATTSMAKKLLESNKYDASAEILKTNIGRPEALQLIEKMIKLLTLQPKQTSVTKLNALVNAYESISMNGHIKLQLINAVLQ